MTKLRLLLISCAIILAVAINNVSAQSKDSVAIKGVKGTRGSISIWGGDITLYRNLTKEGSNKTEKTADIVVSFQRLTELNDNKQPVTDKNNRTHTMASFAKQNFSCVESASATMPYSSNVKADCWYCSTDFMDIFAPARFRIMACIVQNNGTITQSQEVSNVTEGQLKLSIEMTKGWPWCDSNCTGGVGKYLDLSLDIKLPAGIKRAAKANSTRIDGQPTRFELGAGIKVEFSAMSLIDGTWSKLVDNTPILTQNNQTDTVTMRFSRFDNNLLYDPTIDTGNLPFDASSGYRMAAMSLPLLLSISIATVFMTSLLG